MSLLLPDTGLLFWMSIVFFVVLGILWKWGFPAIIKMTDDRKAFIDTSLQNAHDANLKLANLQQEGEAIKQEAREKQAQILREAAETREQIVKKAEDKARDEGARIITEAKQQIATERQAAAKEIKAQVAELSVQIAEKILREKLSTADAQNELIDRLLDGVSVDNTKG